MSLIDTLNEVFNQVLKILIEKVRPEVMKFLDYLFHGDPTEVATKVIITVAILFAIACFSDQIAKFLRYFCGAAAVIILVIFIVRMFLLPPAR